MTKILAIDPGNVTGVASFDTRFPRMAPRTLEIPDGLRGFVNWYMVEDDYDMAFQVNEIAMEDFIIRPDTHKKTREPAVYEIIGWMKGFAYQNGVPYYMYGPSEHTPFSDYKKRKLSKIVRLGWSVPSKDMHADSATSVLLMHLVRYHTKVMYPLLEEIV